MIFDKIITKTSMMIFQNSFKYFAKRLYQKLQILW